MRKLSDNVSILIVVAHPMLNNSRVNRPMANAAAALPNVVLRDLYETYPDFHIDIPAEQALLESADLVVVQHPLHWYSMPSLLKEWTDVVLEAGWAYGQDGNALRGKDYLLAVTTGSGVDGYTEGGLHNWPFGAFLPPFRQTAELCGMTWRQPFLLHGAHQVSNQEIDAHVERYVTLLSSYPHWPQSPHDGNGLASDQLD